MLLQRLSLSSDINTTQGRDSRKKYDGGGGRRVWKLVFLEYQIGRKSVFFRFRVQLNFRTPPPPRHTFPGVLPLGNTTLPSTSQSEEVEGASKCTVDNQSFLTKTNTKTATDQYQSGVASSPVNSSARLVGTVGGYLCLDTRRPPS